MHKTNGYANLFDGIARAADDHPVAYIEGMFDKEEDDTYYRHSASVPLLRGTAAYSSGPRLVCRR
jgi:hypothetical protein